MNKQTETTPPINILSNNEDYLWWSNLISRVHRSLHRPLVRFHKDRLGRQHYCFTSWCRYWVWERSFLNEGKIIGWRAYVNNNRGLGFEVTPNCSKGDIELLVADYLSALDVELADDPTRRV